MAAPDPSTTPATPTPATGIGGAGGTGGGVASGSGPLDADAIADAAVKRAHEAWEKRINDAKAAAANKQAEVERLRQENENLRAQIADTTLDVKERKAREAQVAAAKDRALKAQAATATLQRLVQDAIHTASADGKGVDAAKVTALVDEVIVGTVNPDSDVTISIGSDGNLDVFVNSDTVSRLEKSLRRIVDLAVGQTNGAATPATPGRPGPTPPASRSADGLSGLPMLTPMWASTKQDTALAKAKAKVEEAARLAGQEGLLSLMDTGL